MIVVSAFTRSVLLGGVILLAAFLLSFSRRQNRGGVTGGAIAPSKVLWLGYTVFTWFVLCGALALDPKIPGPFRVVLGVFSGLMWTRGLAEMVMLYGTRNWRPPYGIAHDAVCLASLLATTWMERHRLAALFGDAVAAPSARWLLALVAVVCVSLVLEIGYAHAFHRAVRGKTTGKEGVWFASDRDPVFRRILRATALFNAPLYGFDAALLWTILRG